MRTARFLNRSFPQTYAALSLLPRLARAYRWLQRVEKARLGYRLTALPFDQYRTSETVFILGTGASINDYPQEWWELVQRHDSIGVNFFLLHEHVPTFHVTEDVNDVCRRLLATRYVERGDYRGVPLIIKTQLTNLSSSRVATRVSDIAAFHPDVLSHTYLSMDVLAAGKDVKSMEASYRLCGRLGLWTPKKRFLMLTKRRGSLSYVINLAVRAGYRRIVLCGVDLNHTEYFFDSQREELESAGMALPPRHESGQVHITNDPAHHPVTMHNVIVAIERTLLKPAGIQLFVGSDKSALYPDLPRFDWEGSLT